MLVSSPDLYTAQDVQGVAIEELLGVLMFLVYVYI